MRVVISPLTTAVAVLCASTLAAQGGTGPQLAPPLLSSLTWRNIGPTSISGRVNDIAVARAKGQPDQVYIGFGGGVWKSVNGGTSWTPVFDNVDAYTSVGSLAVAPSNPNVVWVGTGESVNPTADWGDGIYKSIDAGRTWKHMGLRDSRHIGRVVVHPTNPDVVYLAAQGRMWGSNDERGIFKSIDGGVTWRKVLYIDTNTGASDVQMDPSNSQILYASTYQRQRKDYGGILAGPGSAIYKSTDAGEHWTKLTNGLPKVDMGRIGLEISAADPKVIFADIEVGGYAVPASAGGTGGGGADCPPLGTGRGGGGQPARQQFDQGEGGVYRSIDGGETWEHVNSGGDTPVGQFNQIRTDPKDRNRVYRLGTGFYISDDMGKTYRTVVAGIHYEHHAMWVDPDDPNHFLLGTDGGLVITWDRGITFDWKNDIPTGQIEEASISTDARDPFVVCGGLQDNGSICVPSAVRNRNGISNFDDVTVGGGDGMHFHFDPFDTTYALTEADRAQMRRLSLTTMQAQTVKPGPGLARPISCLDAASTAANRNPLSPTVVGPDGKPYRWEWDTPFLFSSVTKGVLYTASNVLFRSTDRGGSWKRISPDLTAKIDRDTIYIMGKKVGALNYSPNGTLIADPAVTSAFGAIISISESPLNPRVLYTGTNDGQVQITRDLGQTWANLTKNIPGLPPFTPVSSVLASQHVAGRVYATFDGHYVDDDHPYVYVSNDYGKTWKQIVSGLPGTLISRIAEHPHDANVLALAHRRGVSFSNDAGTTWQSLNTNMPTVPTSVVMFHPRDNALVASTYGRGIWILDDAGPLQTLTAEAIKKDAVLASITRGRQWNLYARLPKGGEGEYYSPNPEFNPTITYYLRDGASGTASIAISDATGNLMRTLQGSLARGLNRVTWDMHMDAAGAGAGGGGRAGRGGRGGGRGGGGGGRAGGATGPLVLPGKYSVVVTIPGVAQPLRGDLTVIGDPTDSFTAADRKARQDFMMSVYGLEKALATAGGAARLLSAQTDSMKQDLTRGGAAAAGAKADSLTYRVQRVTSEIDRLAAVTGGVRANVESFNSLPTADQRQQALWAADDASRAVATLNAISQTEIPNLYSQFAKGVRPRTVAPVVQPPASKRP